jgi:hypothetical protein
MNDDHLLRDLTQHDVAPSVAEGVRRRAHAILREQRGHARPRMARWVSCYHRILEPAVLITLSVTYLALTVRDTVALFPGGAPNPHSLHESPRRQAGPVSKNVLP